MAGASVAELLKGLSESIKRFTEFVTLIFTEPEKAINQVIESFEQFFNELGKNFTLLGQIIKNTFTIILK